jgi:4-hydroxy-4-methyl-2-oxoglutarate aldolase
MANPPALTIRRNFTRPSTALVSKLREAPTGWIVDANGRRGALDYRIRPITRAMHFCGIALTVHTRPRDNLAPYAAIQYAQAGDVMIIAAEAYEEASVVGDILVGMAKNQGVAALVTDGMVRDVDGLNAVGIPVFARGLSPNSPYKDGPGSVGLPISIGGVAVDAGDVIVGDQDGIVVVPRNTLADVVTALDDVRAKEHKMEQLVAQGAKLPPGMDLLITERGVRYID